MMTHIGVSIKISSLLFFFSILLLCSCNTIKWTSNQVACPDFSTKSNNHTGLKGAKATSLRHVAEKKSSEQFSMKEASPVNPLSKKHISTQSTPIKIHKEQKQIIIQPPTPKEKDNKLSFIEKTAFFLLGMGITFLIIFLTSIIWPIAMIGVVPVLAIYTIIKLTQELKEKEELVYKGILFGIITAIVVFLIAVSLILLAFAAI